MKKFNIPRGVPIPPTIFIILLLLAVLLSNKIIYFNFRLLILEVVGIALIILGIILSFIAVFWLSFFKTPVDPNGKPKFLVLKFPFTLSRNPIYLSMLIILIGESIILGSLLSLILPIIFYFIITKFVIPKEENNLFEAFGAQYISYKESVRRWL
jgi:protein-S-isoprenylcysteine O-methyltransferase Ste14